MTETRLPTKNTCRTQRPEYNNQQPTTKIQHKSHVTHVTKRKGKNAWEAWAHKPAARARGGHLAPAVSLKTGSYVARSLATVLKCDLLFFLVALAVPLGHSVVWSSCFCTVICICIYPQSLPSGFLTVFCPQDTWITHTMEQSTNAVVCPFNPNMI